MPTLCRSNDKIEHGRGAGGVAIRLAADSEAHGRDCHFTDGLNSCRREDCRCCDPRAISEAAKLPFAMGGSG